MLFGGVGEYEDDCCVVSYTLTNVSQMLTAFIVRASGGGSKHLWNVSHFPQQTVQHPRTPTSSERSLPDPRGKHSSSPGWIADTAERDPPTQGMWVTRGLRETHTMTGPDSECNRDISNRCWVPEPIWRLWRHDEPIQRRALEAHRDFKYCPELTSRENKLYLTLYSQAEIICTICFNSQ
jgi:hypothetical protein